MVLNGEPIALKSGGYIHEGTALQHTGSRHGGTARYSSHIIAK